MSKYPLEQFKENGFAVIENFLSEKEADDMNKVGFDMARNAPENTRKIVHSTVDKKHEKEPYYLESGYKSYYFYEDDALDANGHLKTDKAQGVCKIGHAVHLEHKYWADHIFNDRIRTVAKKLGLKTPVVLQSMLIYKNPKVGGEFKPHQDATYFHCDPIESITGFWIPTEDATIENGCLNFIKGSHKKGLYVRSCRTNDPNADSLIEYKGKFPTFPQNEFVACPVKKGSLVILDGLVVHSSEPNRSERSRLAFTFHTMETAGGVKYDSDNWLQLPENMKFLDLYK